LVVKILAEKSFYFYETFVYSIQKIPLFSTLFSGFGGLWPSAEVFGVSDFGLRISARCRPLSLPSSFFIRSFAGRWSPAAFSFLKSVGLKSV